MTKNAKILIEVLRSVSDANMAFSDIISLLRNLGFTERIRGSHHIFSKPDIEEILNIQPIGNKAKPYQVKQVRNIILKYKMELL